MIMDGRQLRTGRPEARNVRSRGDAARDMAKPASPIAEPRAFFSHAQLIEVAVSAQQLADARSG